MLCVYTVLAEFLSVLIFYLQAFSAARIFVRICGQNFVRFEYFRVNGKGIRTPFLPLKNLPGHLV